MDSFETFSSRISNVRHALRESHIDVLAAIGSKKRSAALARASAHVWLSAALESYVKGLIGEVLEEIDAQSVRYCDLRPSVLAFVCAPKFDAVSSAKQEAKKRRHLLGSVWKTKEQVVTRILTEATAEVSIESSLLDGRTLRTYHFSVIWDVFGFSGRCYPEPWAVYEKLIDTLAENRNDLAHGKIDPVDFGRNKGDSDVEKLIGRVEDVAEHLAVAKEDYMIKKVYLAKS